MIEALRHSFGELKLPSSQTLLTRNVPLRQGDSLLCGVLRCFDFAQHDTLRVLFLCFTPYIYIITPIYN